MTIPNIHSDKKKHVEAVTPPLVGNVTSKTLQAWAQDQLHIATRGQCWYILPSTQCVHRT